jgi:hypothetical protein
LGGLLAFDLQPFGLKKAVETYHAAFFASTVADRSPNQGPPFARRVSSFVQMNRRKGDSVSSSRVFSSRTIVDIVSARLLVIAAENEA